VLRQAGPNEEYSKPTLDKVSENGRTIMGWLLGVRCGSVGEFRLIVEESPGLPAPAVRGTVHAPLLSALVHDAPTAVGEFIQVLRGDTRPDAIDIYDHIGEKELRESYLAHIPMLGI